MLTEGTGEKGLTPFSQMQWQPENDVGMCDPEARQLREEGAWWTPKSLGKIINKIDSLEMKMRKMSISDDKAREPPYKPQVAPPRHRGGNRFRRTSRNPKPTLTTSSRGPSGFKRNNGRQQSNFQSTSSSRAHTEADFREMVSEAEVDLIKAQMLADQWSLVRLFQGMPQDVIIVRNQATYRNSVTDAKKMNVC